MVEPAAFSSLTPGQKEALIPRIGGGDFGLLNSTGWVYVLGTHLSAFADERAAPHTFFGTNDVLALVGSVIARVEVVSVRQRNCCRAEEFRVAVQFRAR